MKKLVAILVFSFALNTAVFASSRTDAIVQNDSEERLDKIGSLKSDLLKLDQQSNEMTALLKTELNKNDNQKIFIKIRNTLATGTAIAIPIGAGLASTDVAFNIVGIAFNGAVAKVKIAGFVAASILVTGAVVTAGAEAGVLMTRNDAEKLLANLENLKKQIALKNLNLKNEIKLLCKSEPRHKLCY